MSMVAYILRKLIAVLAVLFVVSMLVFFLGRTLVPGDVSQLLVGTEQVAPEDFARIRAELGLDRPLHLAYMDWLSGAATGDLGTSPLSGRSVASQLRQQIPTTFELAIISLLLTAILGVPLGVVAAVHAGNKADSLIRLVLLTAFAVPTFVTAVFLVYLGSTYLGNLYQTEYVTFSGDPADHLRSLVLPVASIILPTTAVTVQMTRAVMLDVLAEPHITMAYAKGARTRDIRYIHALKSGLPAILTLLALLLGGLLGGVVVVENVFNIPGLGRGIVEAIGHRDFQLLVPQVIVVAAVFTFANVAVEIAHPFIDPRVRQA